MAILHLFLVLLIQGSLTFANFDTPGEVGLKESLMQISPEIKDKPVDFRSSKKDWIDLFLGPNTNLYPSSSVALMTQATNNEKCPEEQLEEIKEMAGRIALAVQSEMANLLKYAMSSYDKGIDDNTMRKKRSLGSPIDSTQLIMRLLKHIKSNNEYQNIAIEKMMTAQEIADKYGIEFHPDPEILSDLAIAANNYAKNLTSLLQDAVDTKHVTKEEVSFFPVEAESITPIVNVTTKNVLANSPYYVYTIFTPEVEQNPLPLYEHAPDKYHNVQPVMNNIPYSDPYPQSNYYYPLETQTSLPAQPFYNPQVNQVSPRPTFFDSISYPQEYYYPQYCAMEPVTPPYYVPFEETIEIEPELVREEVEETVSSRTFVDRDNPSSTTVNHVMTYTVAEKSHFKSPQIDRLPQQLQYSFYLI